jgi:hypothetical protein
VTAPFRLEVRRARERLDREPQPSRTATKTSSGVVAGLDQEVDERTGDLANQLTARWEQPCILSITTLPADYCAFAECHCALTGSFVRKKTEASKHQPSARRQRPGAAILAKMRSTPC